MQLQQLNMSQANSFHPAMVLKANPCGSGNHEGLHVYVWGHKHATVKNTFTILLTLATFATIDRAGLSTFSATPDIMLPPAFLILSFADALGSTSHWSAATSAAIDIAPSKYSFPVFGINCFPCFIAILTEPLMTFETLLSGFPSGSFCQSSVGRPTC